MSEPDQNASTAANLKWASEHLAPHARERFNERLADPAQEQTVLNELANSRLMHEHGRAPAPGPLSAEARNGFACAYDRDKAMAEAEKRFGRGNWNQDPEFMAKLRSTPRHIQSAV